MYVVLKLKHQFSSSKPKALKYKVLAHFLWKGGLVKARFGHKFLLIIAPITDTDEMMVLVHHCRIQSSSVYMSESKTIHSQKLDRLIIQLAGQKQIACFTSTLHYFLKVIRGDILVRELLEH